MATPWDDLEEMLQRHDAPPEASHIDPFAQQENPRTKVSLGQVTATPRENIELDPMQFEIGRPHFQTDPMKFALNDSHKSPIDRHLDQVAHNPKAALASVLALRDKQNASNAEREKRLQDAVVYGDVLGRRDDSLSLIPDALRKRLPRGKMPMGLDPKALLPGDL